MNPHDEYQSNRSDKRAHRPLASIVGTIALSAMVGSAATLVTLSTFHANVPHSATVASSGAIPTMAPAALNDGVGAPASTTVATNAAGSGNASIIAAVNKVEPAVMGVVNYASVSDFFTQQTKLEATGIGTGVLFHKTAQYGYVVTNNHVVEGANKVQVVLGSGHHVQAAVVGTDPYTDLAVLRVPTAAIRSIRPAAFANSNEIQVGEPAIAIGTPMGLDFADTVTAGIVSAKKRVMPVEEPQTETVLDYQAVIQTDAAINPGNSGGPLCNIYGQVIGINSSKIVAQNFEGMGFAIPSNEVGNIANQLMKDGHALHPSLGVAGYSLASLPDQMWPNVPVDYGVWVQRISSIGTRLAGLKPQDVIVAIDNHTVQTMADLRTYLFQEQPGKQVELKVYRNQQELTIKVKLGTMETQNSTNVPATPTFASSEGLNPFDNQQTPSFGGGLFGMTP